MVRPRIRLLRLKSKWHRLLEGLRFTIFRCLTRRSPMARWPPWLPHSQRRSVLRCCIAGQGAGQSDCSRSQKHRALMARALMRFYAWWKRLAFRRTIFVIALCSGSRLASPPQLRTDANQRRPLIDSRGKCASNIGDNCATAHTRTIARALRRDCRRGGLSSVRGADRWYSHRIDSLQLLNYLLSSRSAFIHPTLIAQNP